MAYVKIQTNESMIEINESVDFEFNELPYGAIGYRNNGTSEASEDNLNKYWSFIDTILANNQLNTSEYVTLMTIIDDSGNLYGYTV